MVTQRLRVYGFSCTHYGDRYGHDAPLWREFLEEVEKTENALVFGLGDYLDHTRTSYRPSLQAVWGEDDKARDQHDTMLMETYVYPFVDIVRKHCPSFAKKCVGFVEGNHHGKLLSHRFQNGRTTTEEICWLLGIPYLGLSAWIRVTLYRSLGRTKTGSGHNLNIVLNHSQSSSGTLPASLASAMRLMRGWRDVDVFLTANDHKLGHDTEQMIGCTQRGSPRMMQHEVVVGKVGSFQKGYSEEAESDSYVERKLLVPNRLGWLAFDAWVHYATIAGTDGVKQTPEVWRFGNFNV